jgi:hypothetical protein
VDVSWSSTEPGQRSHHHRPAQLPSAGAVGSQPTCSDGAAGGAAAVAQSSGTSSGDSAAAEQSPCAATGSAFVFEDKLSVLSVYELTPHPDFNFRRGLPVLRLNSGACETEAGTRPPAVAPGKDTDPNDIDDVEQFVDASTPPEGAPQSVSEPDSREAQPAVEPEAEMDSDEGDDDGDDESGWEEVCRPKVPCWIW